MSDADKAICNALFDQTASTAASDMRKRIVLVLVELKQHRAWDGPTLDEAMERIERLSIRG